MYKPKNVTGVTPPDPRSRGEEGRGESWAPLNKFLDPPLAQNYDRLELS